MKIGSECSDKCPIVNYNKDSDTLSLKLGLFLKQHQCRRCLAHAWFIGESNENAKYMTDVSEKY